MAALLTSILLTALAGLFVLRYVARTVNRRTGDPAWKATGIRQSFSGYDKHLQTRGRLEALERQARQRRAAAVVTAFETRRSER